MTTSHGWFAWALASAAFAALTAIFAKIGIQGVDADLATLIRTAIILVVLAGFVAYAGKWSDPLALPRRTWIFLGLSGLATGASWVCYFRALKIGDASKVAPVDKFSLVLVAVFAFAFLGERPSGREWAGIAMVAGGVLVLAIRRLTRQPAVCNAVQDLCRLAPPVRSACPRPPRMTLAIRAPADHIDVGQLQA